MKPVSILLSVIRGKLFPFVISVAVISGVLMVSSCAPTVYDESIATTTITPPSTTEPTGTVEELLVRLSAALDGLSVLIGPDQSGKTPPGRGEQLALIESLWSAAKEPLQAADEAAADSLGRMVALAQTAVQRNRPADADKAARFAGQVIDEFLTRQA
jgi:hypothetical protein